MFPCPRTLALIAPEGIEIDDQRPLCPRGTQAGVDLVKRPRSRRDRQRAGDALRQAIVVKRGAERLLAIGLRGKVPREKVDEVEIRGMGQRAAAKPSQREDHELTPGHRAVCAGEFVNRRVRQHVDRRLRHTRVPRRHRKRIGRAGDDLRAKRKPMVVDDPANVIKPGLEIGAPLSRSHLLRQHGDLRHRIKRGGIDQPVEQVRSTRQLIGERRRVAQQLAKQRRERRTRFQQAKDVHRARKPLKQAIQPNERRTGRRRLRECRHQTRQHRLQRHLRRTAAEGGIAGAPPCSDPRGRSFRISKPGFSQLILEGSPIGRKRRRGGRG